MAELALTRRARQSPSILVVDDDPGTRDTFEWALRREGYTVRTAASGEQGLDRARSSTFDLVIVDLRLPDMLGTAVIKALGSMAHRPRFMLISGLLNTALTVEAVKLGAVDVLEKPIDVDMLPGIVRSAVADGGGPAPTAPPLTGEARPRSAAERWAAHVLDGCQSAADLKTLQDWARCVGVSRSTLCENCRLLGVSPHDARDFLRMLRAVLRSRQDGCPVEALLDVSDRRTLDHLLQRAGLARHTPTPSVEEFVRQQRFVPAGHAGLRALCAALARRHS